MKEHLIGLRQMRTAVLAMRLPSARCAPDAIRLIRENSKEEARFLSLEDCEKFGFPLLRRAIISFPRNT